MWCDCFLFLQSNRGIESDESGDEESEDEEDDGSESELVQNDGQVTNRMNINIIAENARLAVTFLNTIWFLGVKYFIQ